MIWHHTVPGYLGGVFRHFGNEGVTLFFAISGYLITTLMLREVLRTGRFDFRAFYWRRGLRIFPLYFGSLALYVVLVFLIERHNAVGQEFFRNLPYFLTYTSNLFVELKVRTIFYFAWSLATEEQFYLVWPIVFVWVKTPFRASLLLGFVLIACIFSEIAGSRSLSLIPIALLGGALLAIVLHNSSGFNFLVPYLGRKHSASFAIFVLGYGLATSAFPGYLIHVLCVGLVATCVIREDNGIRKALCWKPLEHIGMISYGMYMLHMLSRNAVIKCSQLFAVQLSEAWYFPLTVLASVLAANLSYRYYESYFLAMKVRFVR